MVDEAETDAAPASQPPNYLRAASASFGPVIFVFGILAGFLLTFTGLAVVEDSIGILLLVFLAATMFIAAFGQKHCVEIDM